MNFTPSSMQFPLFLRRRQPDAEWFMHLAAIYYALSQVWGGYLIGPMSFVTGVVMTGAPLVGFILLTRRVTLVATLVAFGAILAINLAAAYGIYAFAALLSVVFVIKYVNETNGKELEQMQG